MHRMDPSKASKTKNNENSSSSSQQPPPVQVESAALPPINQPVFTDRLQNHILLRQSFEFTPPHLVSTQLFDRGVAEDKVPIQNPFNTKTLKLLSEETDHQEKAHGPTKRCRLQFGEAEMNAHGSNNSTVSAHVPEEPLSPGPFSDARDTRAYSHCRRLYLNSIMNAAPPVPFATTDVVLSQGLKEPSSSTPSSCLASVHRNNKIDTADAENSEKLNQPGSNEKKRPKTTGTDPCDFKGCYCKKGSCLKIYCECFAAQRFCAESCGCLGCSNKQEYHDKVKDSKQKIKSHNALSFSPKVVQNDIDISSNNMESEHLKTPSSAKHRRGCRCRKSKCEKKCCKCYAGKVGCCNGCQCEGCENIYGRKEEHVAGEHLPSIEMDNGRVEKVSHSSHEELGDDHVHGISPPTPSSPSPCSDVRQSSSVSLTNQVRQVISMAITPDPISGASLDHTQISEQIHLPLFGDPLRRPHSSSTSFTPSNPSNPKDKDSS